MIMIFDFLIEISHTKRELELQKMVPALLMATDETGGMLTVLLWKQ